MNFHIVVSFAEKLHSIK